MITAKNTTEFEKIREWCLDKGSPWFTKADAKRILGRNVDLLLPRWINFGDVKHEKGSRWYKITIMEPFISTPRYRVDFDRIKTPRFHDVSHVSKAADQAVRGIQADSVVFDEAQDLLKYDLEIRELFNKLMLDDILAEEA